MHRFPMTLMLRNFSAIASLAFGLCAVTAAFAAEAPRLYSLSVRTALEADQVLIVGFTMSGGAKNVLLRAAGPTLGAFGVSQTMSDPKLDLYAGSARTATNDNWGGSSSLAATFQAAGAFAYSSATSLDAALVASIEGSRTAHVYGPSAGTVLVEGYEVGSGDGQKFTSLSARNRVGTGDNILIAGFSLTGAGMRNLLIRAIGPTLGAFGVPNTLSDPKVEIYQGTTKIAENDNWSSTLSTTFSSVGAFPLTAGSKDAAITVSLPAGGYTVHVSGVAGGVGEALVEIYELPTSGQPTVQLRKFQADGCHAKVSATLQIKEGNVWKDVVAAQGWEATASCPTTNLYRPWAMAEVAIGSTIRWYIYSPGAWNFYTVPTQVAELFDPNSFPTVVAQANIESSNYPLVAALARASILADQPAAPTSQKVTFQFESGVPIENQNMIRAGADKFISHFGNILNYSEKAIHFIVYSTNAGGIELGKIHDASDAEFIKDLTKTLEGNPNRTENFGMGGFSMSAPRVVVIGSSFFRNLPSGLPFHRADPLVTPHELMHQVQASINKGKLLRNPVWLCEGNAQVVGAVMSLYQGRDYWASGGRDSWSIRVPANRAISDLKLMEGEDEKISEYTTGAALSEYLIAWGGFKNSLLVSQIALRTQNPDGMAGFRQAFKIVYGQSLDDFYIHALPYINYVSANSKTSYATSPEALTFMSSDTPPATGVQ